MERFGDLELLMELATGGMATVHVGRHVGDAGFERLVAIKRVHRHLLSDPDVFSMLSDEARLSALVRHPNVVPTNQVIDKDGELLLVQDYVEGVSLALLAKRAAARLPGGALPIDVALRIVLDLLRGLHAAHEAMDMRGEPLHLVHRDVSPQNVLVGADGTSRLIDFGIAQAEGRLAETRSGVIKGKLAYMAPEQLAEAPTDRRADVFAAAVLLRELIVGRAPTEGPRDVEAMARRLLQEVDLAPVADRAPMLLEPLKAALRRDPERRTSSAEAFAEALLPLAAPVSDATMRALMGELVGDVLEARRDQIRASMGRADEAPRGATGAPQVAAAGAQVAAAGAEPMGPTGPGAALDGAEATPHPPTPASTERAHVPTPHRRPRAAWAVGGLALAALGAAALLAGGPAEPVGEADADRPSAPSAVVARSAAAETAGPPGEQAADREPGEEAGSELATAATRAPAATPATVTPAATPATVTPAATPATVTPAATPAATPATATPAATPRAPSELHENPYGR